MNISDVLDKNDIKVEVSSIFQVLLSMDSFRMGKAVGNVYEKKETSKDILVRIKNVVIVRVLRVPFKVDT